MSNDRKPWDHVHETSPCTFADIGTATGDDAADFIEQANAYLECFAAPIWVPFSTKPDSTKVMACLHCGAHLTGMFAGLIERGGFEWGLVHGEGHCAACGWPARAYHFAKDRDGKELFTLRTYVLQYRPDPEREAEARAKAEVSS